MVHHQLVLVRDNHYSYEYEPEIIEIDFTNLFEEDLKILHVHLEQDEHPNEYPIEFDQDVRY